VFAVPDLLHSMTFELHTGGVVLNAGRKNSSGKIENSNKDPKSE
jgi:hypothetical protein